MDPRLLQCALLVYGIACIYALFPLQSCTTCENKETCCGGEVCCSGGSFCCANTSTCCQDTCCANGTQTCCNDPKEGGVCCESETSFCCKRTSELHPSRCCPRWFVCCDAGRYGCCNPDTLLPLEATTAYAMFVEPQFVSPAVPMKTFGLDVSTGYRGAQHTVDGPFNDWGESTRVFMWNGKKMAFYLLQANFTGHHQPGGGEITFYTVDAVSGKGSAQKVSGASSEVTGYAFHEPSQVVYFATYSSEKKTGYSFYKLDLTSATASRISTHNFGSPLQDDYAGWFTAVSDDGRRVYRMGYRNVVAQTDTGLAIVDVSHNTANVTFQSVAAPSGHGFFISFNLYHEEYLSLAPDAYGYLNLFKWGAGATATKLASLGGYQTPYFGPLAEAVSVSQNFYAAMVVEHELDSNFDRWGVVYVDLQTGSATLNGVWPYMLADTDSVSGFGFPGTHY